MKLKLQYFLTITDLVETVNEKQIPQEKIQQIVTNSKRIIGSDSSGYYLLYWE